MRREEKKRRTRRRILEAAVRVFARDGVHEARVSDIAREAGVGHGTVYLYFKGKPGILHAIYGELMAQVLDEVREYAGAGTNAVEKLSRLMEALHGMVQEHRELTQLLLIETRQSGEFLRSPAVRRVEEFVDYIAEILQEGVQEGRFRREALQPGVATFLFAGLEGVIIRWLLDEQAGPLDRIFAEVLEVLLDGLCQH